MARTAVPITLLVPNSSTNSTYNVATVTATALDATNSHNVANFAMHRQRVHITIISTTGSTKTATFKAGAHPLDPTPGAAALAKLGDYVLSVPANATVALEIDTMRFAQADGSLNIDLQAAFTGSIFVTAVAHGIAGA